MNDLKNEKKPLVSRWTYGLTAVVCFLPLLAGAILYPRFPEQMVIHWGADGEPNGWAHRVVAVFVLPGVLFGLQLFMPALIKADPKNKNLNPKIANLLCWILPLVSLVCSTSTVMTGLGLKPQVQIITPMVMGFLFLVIGNFLPKTTQSYTVGIKLPWTLHSEENWKRTHRLAGFLWAAGGIVTIVGAFFSWRVIAITVSVVAMIAVPVVYSYILYKKGI